MFLIIILVGIYYIFSSGIGFTIAGTPEQQVQQEYIRYWSDTTDGTPYTTNGFSLSSDQQSIESTATSGTNTQLTFDKTFNGQHIALVMSARGKSDSGGSTGGSCQITPYGSPACGSIGNKANFNCPQTLIEYKPRTFDPSVYDVYQSGIKIAEFDSGDGFQVGLKCIGAGGTGEFTGSLDFIGYKAQFECDISESEVWIERQIKSNRLSGT